VGLGTCARLNDADIALLFSFTLDMMVHYIERKLFEKSTHHREALSRLEAEALKRPLSDRVVILGHTPQLSFMNTILQDIDTDPEDFIFYFDRLASLIIEQCVVLLSRCRQDG
jgi:uridine kinase